MKDKTRSRKREFSYNAGTYALVLAVFVFFAISSLLFSADSSLTGRIAVEDIDAYVLENNVLSGSIDISVEKYDYLPTTTKLLITYDGQSIEIPFSDLASDLATVDSEYSYNSIYLNKSGAAYTTRKYKLTKPTLMGQLIFSKDDLSKSIEFEVSADNPYSYISSEECFEISEDIITYYNNTIINTYDVEFNCTYLCNDESCNLIGETQLNYPDLDLDIDTSCVATFNQTLPNQNNTETILVEHTTISVNDTTIVEENNTETSTEVICYSIDDLNVDVDIQAPYQISVSNDTIVVSTNYTSKVYGEGPEYIYGDDQALITYNLEDANIYAIESGVHDLSVELVYQDVIFAEYFASIEVNNSEDMDELAETPVDEDPEMDIIVDEPEVNLSEVNLTSNFTNVVDANISVEDNLSQGYVEVGKDVEWTRTIKLKSDNLSMVNISLILPDKSKDISIVEVADFETKEKTDFEFGDSTIDDITEEVINKIAAEEEVEKEIIDIKDSLEEIKTDNSITNETKEDVQLKENVKEKVKKSLKEKGIEKEEVKKIKLSTLVDEEKDLVVKYTTEGPTQNVQDISETQKVINVNSEVHYTNIKTGYDLPIQLSEEKASRVIQLYQVVNETRVPYQQVTFVDADANGLVDRIEWIIPHLSNATYEIQISILTVHSEPAVGQNWRIKFDTMGIADLSVYGFDGTLIGTDVDYTYLKCGDSLVDNVVYSNGTIFVEDYSCDSTSELALMELLPGKHSVRFEFGTDFGEAFNLAGLMNCTLRQGACGLNETAVLRLSNYTNAHAELFDQSSPEYNYTICCWDDGYEINISANYTTGSEILGDAAILSLSNYTNAHAGNISDYMYKLWLNSTQSLFSTELRLPGQTCEEAGYQTCIVTMSNATNAHLASCDNESYDYKVCGVINNRAPVVTLLSPGHDSYINSNFNFSYSASDADGIVDIRNCTLWTNISGAGFTLYDGNTNVNYTNNILYTFAAAEEKQIEWQVNCTDLADEHMLSSMWTLYTDNINPSIHTLYSDDPDNYTRSDASLTYYVNSSDTYMDNVTLQNLSMSLSSGLYQLTTTPSSLNCTIEGSCIVYAYANDKANNHNSTNYTMIIDDTFPEISFIGNTADNDSYLSQNYTEMFVSIVEINQRNNSFYLYNESMNLINKTTYSLDTDENFTYLPDGIYYYKADVWDKADNYNSTELRKITLDTTNPALYNLTLNNNETNNLFYIRSDEYITFLLDGIERNIDYVEIGNDTLMNMSVGSNSGDNYTWQLYETAYNLGCDSDGACLITATAYDLAGNTQSISFNMTIIDDEAPVVTLFAPVDYFNTTNTTVPITFNVTDNLAPSLACYLYVDGVQNNVNLSTANNVQTTINAFLTQNKTDYEYNISCYDLAGNMNNTIIKHFTVDQEKPAVVIERPDIDEIIGRTITFEALVSDIYTNVEDVWFVVYNRTSDDHVYNATMPFVSGTTYRNSTFNSLTYCVENATACPVYVLIYANDTVNNLEIVRRNFTLDNNRPSIFVELPWYSYHNNNFNLNLSAEDYLINITYYNITNATGDLYQSNYTPDINNPTHAYYDLVNISNYPDGNYSLYYYAQDYFGNNLSKITWFMVDTQAPSLANFLSNDPDAISKSDINLQFNITAFELHPFNATMYNKNNMSAKKVMSTTDIPSFLNYGTIAKPTLMDCSDDGVCELVAIVYDKAGNSDQLFYNLTIDSTNPEIEFNTEPIYEHTPYLTPVNDSFISQDWFNINVTIIDANRKNVTFRLFEAPGQLISSKSYDLTSYGSSITEFNSSFNNLNDTYYYYDVITYDFADNYNVTELRKVAIDTTPPSIFDLMSNDEDNISRSDNQLNFTVDASDIDLNYVEYGNNTILNMTRLIAPPSGTPLNGLYYYAFNGNSIDQWDGNNLNWPLSSSYSGSYPTYGLYFSGATNSGSFSSGRYAQTTSPIIVDSDAGAISVWINPNFNEGVPFTRYVFSTNNMNSGKTALYYNGTSNSWNLYVHNTPIFSGPNAITGLTTSGQWTHIVFTWNNTKQSLYRNGELKASASVPLASTQKSETLYIGASHSISNKFEGLIDEFKYFNTTLSLEEAKRLYEYGDTRPMLTWINSSNLSTICNGITEGPCMIGAIAYDKAMNSNVTYYEMIVDDESPELYNLNSSDYDNYTRNDVMLNFSIDIVDSTIKFVELGNYTFVNMSMDYMNMTNSTWSRYINASALGCVSEGICTVFAIAHDFADNTNMISYNLTIDNTNPVVTLFSPVDNYNTSSTTVPIEYNVTDNLDDNLECYLYVDGQLNNTNLSTSENVQTITNALIGSNQTGYAYNISCVDSAGNTHTSITKYFTVDQELPSITITRPVLDEIVGRNVSISSTITDAFSAVDSAWYEVRNVTGDGLMYSAVLNDLGGNVYNDNSFDSTITCPETYDECFVYVVVYANDTVNNLQSARTNFTIDNKDPTLHIEMPWYSYHGDDFAMNISSINHMINVSYYNITNSSGVQYQYNYTDYINSPTHAYYDMINLSNFPDDNYTLYYYTRDYANNSMNKSTWFIIDTMDPVMMDIHSNDQDNISTSNVSIEFNVTVTELYVENVTLYNLNNMSASTSMSAVGSGLTVIYTTTNTLEDLACTNDGVCELMAETYDKAGNLEQAYYNMTVDNSYPVIYYNNETFDTQKPELTPIDNSYVSQDWFNINVTIFDATKQNVTFTLYNGSQEFNQSFTYDLTSEPIGMITADHNFTILADGDYYFDVITYDFSNNYNITERRKVTIDTSYPTITNLYSDELDNVTRSDVSHLFNVTVTELSVSNVTLYNLNNMALPAPMSTTDSTLTKDYSISTTLDAVGCSSDGICELMAAVYDLAGNLGTTYYNITVDDTDPVVSFNVPPTSTDNYYSDTNTFSLNVTVTDDNEYSIEYYVFNESNDQINYTIDYLGLRYITFTHPDGIYYYNVTVVDQAGNDGSSPTYKITIDNGLPVSAIISPLNQSSIGKNDLPFLMTGNASDNHLLDRIDLDLNGSTVTATGTTSWSYSWNPTEDGNYTIRSIAYDEATNSEVEFEYIYVNVFTTSTLQNSSIDDDSTVTNSTIVDSNITDSDLDNSTSTNSNLNNVTYTNVNITDSSDENSEVLGGFGDIIFDPCRLGSNSYYAPLHVTDSRIFYSTLSDSYIINGWINNTYVDGSTLNNSIMQIFDPDGKPTNNFNLARFPILDSRIIDSDVYDSTFTNSNATSANVSMNSTLLNSQAINATIVNCTLINLTFTDDVCSNNLLIFSNISGSNVTGDSYVENSTVTNSTVDDSEINDSTVIESNVSDGSTITDNSTVENSNVSNSTIEDMSNITDSTITNGSTVANSTVTNSTVDDSEINDSTVIESNVSDGSTITDNSTVENSNISNSTIEDMSNITDSTITNGSTVVNSTIDDSTVEDSLVNQSSVDDSNVTDSQIVEDSEVIESDISNSTIVNSTVDDSEINDSIIEDAIVNGSTVTEDSIIDLDSEVVDSVVTNSTITEDSTVINSTIEDSLVNDSTVIDSNVTDDSVILDDSLVNNSDISDSIITNDSIVIDSTISNDSIIINSTVTNSTVINCTNIINMVLADDYCVHNSIVNFPTVNLNYPDNDSYTPSNTINFNWTAIQDRELVDLPQNLLCNLTINDVINMTYISSPNGTPTIHSATGLADGIYYWNVTCKDEIRFNTSETRRSVVDTTNPTIQFELPTKSNGNHSNVFNVNVSAFDTNEVLIEFRVFNITHDIVNYTNSTTKLRNLTYVFPDGLYYYNVTITDIVGRYNSTETRSMTLDTINPETYGLVSNDTDNISRNDVLYKFDVFANDTNMKDVNINGKYFTQNGSTPMWFTTSNLNTLGCAVEGPCTIVSIARDQAHNTNITNMTLTIDNTLPNVTNFTSNDTDNKVVGSQEINFSAYVSDNHIDVVQVYCNPANSVNLTSSGTNWSVVTTASTIGCVQGINNVVLKAVDFADNIEYEYYLLDVDNDGPNVTLISPANHSSITTAWDASPDQTTVEHVFTTNDDQNVTYCTFHNTINGESMSTVAATINNPTKNSLLNFSQVVTPQKYTWKIRCYDQLGNYRDSDEFEYEVISGIRTITISRTGAGGGVSCTPDVNYTEWSDCVDDKQYRDRIETGCGIPKILIESRTCVVPSKLELYTQKSELARDKGHLYTVSLNLEEVILISDETIALVEDYLDKDDYDTLGITASSIEESKNYLGTLKEYLEKEIMEKYGNDLTDDLYSELSESEKSELLSDVNYAISLANKLVDRLPDVQNTLTKCVDYEQSENYLLQYEFDQSDEEIKQYIGSHLDDVVLITKCANNYKFIKNHQNDAEFIYRNKYSLTLEALTDLKDVVVTDVIPKEIAGSAYDVDSNLSFKIIEEDPVIQFTVDELYSRQPYLIDYIVKTNSSQREIGVVSLIDGEFFESCNDFVLNQDEENIDCGGSCLPCRKDREVIFLPMLWRFMLVGLAIFALLVGYGHKEKVFRTAYYYVEGLIYTPKAIGMSARETARYTAKQAKSATLTTAQGFDYVGRAIGMFIWIVYETLMSVIEYIAELPVNIADEFVTLVYVLTGSVKEESLKKYYFARFVYIVIDGAESLLLSIGLSIYNAFEALLNIIVYSVKNVLLAIEIAFARAYGYASDTYAKGAAHVTRAGRHVERTVDKHTATVVKTPYDIFDKFAEAVDEVVLPIVWIVLDIPIFVAELIITNVPIVLEWSYNILNAFATLSIDVFDFVYDAFAQSLDLIFDVIAGVFGEFVDLPYTFMIMFVDKFMRNSFKKTVKVQKEVASRGQKYGISTLFIEIAASIKYMVFEFNSFMSEVGEVFKYIFTFEFLKHD